jgi:hypothetical protein
MSSSSSKSKAHLRLRSDSNRTTFTNMLASVEAAAAESLSEDALVHLKSYKYSSVDESYISNYILKHYVRPQRALSLGMLRYTGLANERIQWNACVEFLPLWLAPNMVTLLGFFCIISNVIFLVIWQPEMNGQVRNPLPHIPQRELQLMFESRIRHGSTTASPSASGPTQPWTTSTASKRAAPAPRAPSASSSTTASTP